MTMTEVADVGQSRCAAHPSTLQCFTNAIKPNGLQCVPVYLIARSGMKSNGYEDGIIMILIRFHNSVDFAQLTARVFTYWRKCFARIPLPLIKRRCHYLHFI